MVAGGQAIGMAGQPGFEHPGQFVTDVPGPNHV